MVTFPLCRLHAGYLKDASQPHIVNRFADLLRGVMSMLHLCSLMAIVISSHISFNIRLTVFQLKRSAYGVQLS